MEETGHKFERLKVEQSAFDARLDTLLQEHPGEFVVFKDQQTCLVLHIVRRSL